MHGAEEGYSSQNRLSHETGEGFGAIVDEGGS